MIDAPFAKGSSVSVCAYAFHNNASTGREHLSKRRQHQMVAVVREKKQNGTVELQHAVDRSVLRERAESRAGTRAAAAHHPP
jgi:hypothetical protein